MNREVFLDGINRAKKSLEFPVFNTNGVCDTLGKHLNHNVTDAFDDFMSPIYDPVQMWAWWLGNNNKELWTTTLVSKERVQKHRVEVLELFAQICLDTELYERF